MTSQTSEIEVIPPDFVVSPLKTNLIIIFNDEKLKKLLQCHICNCVLMNPLITKCFPDAHTFCASCLVCYLRDNKLCPICKTTISQEIKEYSTNYLAQSIIFSQKCKCPCGWCGIYSDLSNHLVTTCSFYEINCINSHLGCQCHTTSIKMKDHLRECLYQKIICEKCHKTEIFRKDMNEHINTFCSETNVQCIDCKEMISRKSISDHSKICQRAKIVCEFVMCGCDEKIERKDMKDHLKKFSNIHMNKVNEFIRQELWSSKLKTCGRINMNAYNIINNEIKRKYVLGQTQYDIVIKKSSENNNYYFYLFNPNPTDRYVTCNFTFLVTTEYYYDQHYSLSRKISGGNKCGWGFCLGTDDLRIFYDNRKKKIKINYDNFKEDILIIFNINETKDNCIKFNPAETTPIKYTVKLLKINDIWKIYFYNNDENERFIKLKFIIFDKNMSEYKVISIKDKFKSDKLSENNYYGGSLEVSCLNSALPFVDNDGKINIGLRDFEVWG